MDGPDLPYLASDVWTAFLHLSRTRGQGFNGPLPLTYTEVKAWMELTDTFLLPWQIQAVMRLDAVYMRVMNNG